MRDRTSERWKVLAGAVLERACLDVVREKVRPDIKMDARDFLTGDKSNMYFALSGLDKETFLERLAQD
jgi:hypothetical protein